MSDSQAIIIEIPRAIERHVAKEWGDGAHSGRALEALVVKGYRPETLSAGQVAELLGLSGWETDTFLKERGAYLHYTAEDLEADQQTHERLFTQ